MVWAFLAYLFLSRGHGMLETDIFSSKTDAVIKKVVPDEARKHEALRICEKARKDVEAALKRATKTAEKFEKIDANHEAGLAELQPFLDLLSSERASARKEVLDATFALRKALTEEDWNAVFAKGYKP